MSEGEGAAFDEEYIEPHGECALEINKLKAENARLREGLLLIVDEWGSHNPNGDNHACSCADIATDALAELAPGKESK